MAATLDDDLFASVTSILRIVAVIWETYSLSLSLTQSLLLYIRRGAYTITILYLASPPSRVPRKREKRQRDATYPFYSSWNYAYIE